MLKFDIQNCTSEPLALQGPKKQGVKEGLMMQLYPSLSTSHQTPLPVRFFVPMPSVFVCFCVSFALAQVRSVLKCSLDTSCLRTSWKHSLQPVVLQRTSNNFLLIWTENLWIIEDKSNFGTAWFCGLLLLAFFVGTNLFTQHSTRLPDRLPQKTLASPVVSSTLNAQQTTIFSNIVSNGVVASTPRPNTLYMILGNHVVWLSYAITFWNHHRTTSWDGQQLEVTHHQKKYGYWKGSMGALKKSGGGHWSGSMGAWRKGQWWNEIGRGQWGHWNGSMGALVRVNEGIEKGQVRQLAVGQTGVWLWVTQEVVLQKCKLYLTGL